MSIRIHALAKELNVPNKELIDFINRRQDIYHLEIKTPSNAIDPFTAEAIGKDFAEYAASKAEQTSESANAAEPSVKEPADQKAQASAEETQKAEDKAENAKAEPAAEQPVKQKPISAEKKPEPLSPPPVAKRPAPLVPPAANKPAAVVPPAAAAKPAPAVPPSVSKAPAPAVPPSVSKSPAPAVPPRVSKSPAPVVPPSRPKISMPEIKPSQPQKRDVQPEVVIKFNQKPEAPREPARKPAPLVPPTISKSPAPAVPPSMGKAPAPLVPPVSKAAPVVPPMPGRAPAPLVPPQSSHMQPHAAQEKKEFKTIQLKAPIIVRDFAKAMDLKPFRLISELMDMGIFASMNQSIEDPTAIVIAKKHGFNLDIRHRGEQQQPKKKEAVKRPEDDIKNYVPRPPIVCILGHVDHGKTTLLDTIRNTNVVAGEAGGITQHTAAYQVTCNGKKITFLDTPGHAAFSKMRERGANVTDIAILVVAADDGFMPQTDEALSFAQKAGVPIVVAINKMDAKGANIDRVKQQMQKRGITSEDWGGEVLCTPISALKGENIDKLLELVLLQAEIMELKANPKAPVEGVIIESQLEQGRGATSTVIVRQGTLKTGDVIISGEHWCKVRALIDDKGGRMKEAAPSTPALVMGWTGAPEAGDSFEKVDNDREAKRITEEAIRSRKLQAAAESEPHAASIEELMAAIENKDHKVYKCIVKSDVSGTVEALVACLKDIKSDKVGLEVIAESVGQITKNDVDLAATAGASIVAFNVKQENGVAGLAKHKGVEIVSHNIIYELINTVKEAMKNLLDPELRENKLGAAEVRQLFNISKGGKVAGCMVTEGIVKNGKFARVFRKGREISSRGKISEIKRFKDDVAEVRAGYECGITLNNFTDFEPGDVIECFEILEIRPEL